jgi:hypothetical protein
MQIIYPPDKAKEEQNLNTEEKEKQNLNTEEKSAIVVAEKITFLLRIREVPD